MATDPDTKSFVLRSTYRMNVVQSLSRVGQLTPTSIAQKTGIRQPHVSRTLSELRQEGLVSLAVPEDQHKGRLYELTEFGEEIWSETNQIHWQNDVANIPSTHREIVAHLHQELGEKVTGVGYYDGSTVSMYYFHDQMRHKYSEEQFVKSSETLIEEFSHTDTEAAEIVGELRYEVQSFTELNRIVIYSDGGFLTIGLQSECQFEYPSLIEDCQSILNDASE
ncbi:winged helix-turn-helix domain-containing protein [Haloplanus salilacus]|uniref:winged helix-turn-helix domain-containing protein n=1 Tax=Haloplanus salilacus TaxID=2949994 RepID=UPI0030CC1D00